MPRWSGRFITFEGIDGAGKTTQQARVAKRLRESGIDAAHEQPRRSRKRVQEAAYSLLETREPDGSLVAEAAREIILTFEDLDPRAETFLFLAARAHHFHAKILPALEEGKIVLCDRFMDSTVAYQHGGHGLPLAAIESMNLFATSGHKPDLTLLLDLDIEKAARRVQERDERKTRFEEESLAFRRRVREAYLRIAESEPDRVKIVDAALDEDAVEAQIWEHIETAIAAEDRR